MLKKKNKMKNVLLYSLIIVISLSAGYAWKVLNSPEQTAMESEWSEKELQQIKTIQEEVAHNLAKTYILSSINYDWETVKAMSTGNYKESVEALIEAGKEKPKEEEISFNSNSMKTIITSITKDSAVANVKYILKQKNVSHQRELNIFLSRDKGSWKIFDVEVVN